MGEEDSLARARARAETSMGCLHGGSQFFWSWFWFDFYLIRALTKNLALAPKTTPRDRLSSQAREIEDPETPYRRSCHLLSPTYAKILLFLSHSPKYPSPYSVSHTAQPTTLTRPASFPSSVNTGDFTEHQWSYSHGRIRLRHSWSHRGAVEA